MGWLALIVLALAVLAALWRFAGLDRPVLQFVAAALLLGMAGYGWQGRPGLAGKPVPSLGQERLPDSEFAQMRGDTLGRFDNAARWLTIAEVFQRSGDTQNAVDVIRTGVRRNPRDPDLWVGLGNALVVHADGLMSPAAELAFKRAERLAPNHPGPKFFFGLALAQGGRLEEAESIWRGLLATTPPGEWREIIEEKLALIEQARMMARGL